MRYCIYINKVHASLLLLLIGVLLAACSDDSDRDDGETDVLQLVAYSQGMTDLEPVATTRAIPTGYHEYTGPSSIGVYSTSADEAPSSIRTFSYDADQHQWKSLVNTKLGLIYYIYGYMPASSVIHCAISKRTGTDMDFSKGAVLTFSDLPPVLSEDFCVVTGVQQLDNKTDDVNLTPWVFAFTGKSTGNNFACLMLDHLYSCVKFRFLVNTDYDKLRTIKLKKVELKTTQQVSYPLTVTMKAGENYEVAWGTATGLTNDYVSLPVSEGGVILSATTVKEVEGYFAPMTDVADNLVLQCTYDVYDKNVTTEHPEGNLVRHNCVAVNKLPASIIEAGVNKRTVLTLTVNPTYLYVLSDPDLDNPTITISN